MPNLPNLSNIIDRDATKLAPFFAQRLDAALKECNAAGLPVMMFEGYRSKDRQLWLFEQGRSRPGRIVTNARPGMSWHQYCCAADLAGYVDGQWTWAIDYSRIRAIMLKHHFETLTFEQAHFQMTGGILLHDAQLMSLEELWTKIALTLP